MKCPKCGSDKIVKFGEIPTVKSGRKKRFRCQECGRTFYAG